MLSAVANAVMAVLATQVTVERAFSALKYIYSDLRANLKDELFEHILIIKLNNAFEKLCKR
jgi:orotate phosphoribosyltransferase